MGSRKIIMLVGSILIGALAGFALLSYVQGLEDDLAQDKQLVEVYVVAKPIKAGETAASVRQTGRIELRPMESSFKPPNAVTDLKQIQGRVALNPLAENQVLVVGMFENPEVVETTFSDLIEEDQVAFSLTIDPKRAVGGFIEPGDFVDMIVLGTEFIPPGDADAFDNTALRSPYKTPARYLYRGVRIIGINDEIVGQSAEDGPLPDGEAESASLSIMLAVPADAAQRILSVPEGDLVLSLLPDQWEPEARPNEVEDEILLDVLLPGEDGGKITPYGSDGFESLSAQLEADSGIGDDADALKKVLDTAGDPTTNGAG